MNGSFGLSCHQTPECQSLTLAQGDVLGLLPANKPTRLSFSDRSTNATCLDFLLTLGTVKPHNEINTHKSSDCLLPNDVFAVCQFTNQSGYIFPEALTSQSALV